MNNPNLEIEFLLAKTYMYCVRGDILECTKILNEFYPYLFSEYVSSQSKSLCFLTMINIAILSGDFSLYKTIKKNFRRFIPDEIRGTGIASPFLDIWESDMLIASENYQDAYKLLLHGIDKNFSAATPHLKGQYYHHLGYLKALLKDEAGCRRYLNKSETLYKHVASTFFIVLGEMMYIASFTVLGKYEEALIKIEKAFNLSKNSDGILNHLALYAHRAWILSKLGKIEACKSDLIKIGELLNYDDGGYFFTLRKSLVKDLSIIAVRNQIYPNNFKKWAKKYCFQDFNEKCEPIPILYLKTFGEFAFYFNGEKILTSSDFTKKEMDFFYYILPLQTKTIDTLILTEALWPEKNDKQSKASMYKFIERLRSKFSEKIRPFNAKDYIVIAEGSCIFKGIETDFDSVYSLINSAEKKIDLAEKKNIWEDFKSL